MSEIRKALKRRIPYKDTNTRIRSENAMGDLCTYCPECKSGDFRDDWKCPHCNKDRDRFIDECCLAWEFYVRRREKWVGGPYLLNFIDIPREFLSECVREWEKIYEMD